MFDAQVTCERQVLPMNCNKKDLLLYAVTDRSWLNGRTLYDQVEEALKGGATFIQLREKNQRVMCALSCTIRDQ